MIIRGEKSITKRMEKSESSSEEGHRINEQITIDPIRLIDNEGNMVGVVSLKNGLEKAEELGLDLVEVSPNAKPPVCRIIDYGKFKYAAQKKAAGAKKKQKTIDVKEIKFRPNIDTHDYEVKMRSVKKFLKSGDKVKVTMRFRGREMSHQEIGVRVLEKIRNELASSVKIEQYPKLEGRQMVQIFAPNFSERVVFSETNSSDKDKT